jgi:hypothetical protein
MIRGTTAQFKFKLPCAKGELEWATIKFWQSNNPSVLLPITKTLQHCSNQDSLKELCVSLTAEETMRFSDKYKAKVQMRALHAFSGTIFGTKQKLISVYPVQDGGQEDDIPGTTESGYIILDGEEIV